MIARLIIGGIVVFPAYYWRPSLTLPELSFLVVLALVVAWCMPDTWHE